MIRHGAGIQPEVGRNRNLSNQAVSKWESAQCCPDIQLLPDIAKLFEVSVDELLGYTPVSTSEDIVLMLRKKIEALPQGDDFDFAFRMAAALHVIIFSKPMTAAPNANPGWDTDDAIEHAGNAEWGYSCWNIPGFTTIMRSGAVFFSNNKSLNPVNPDVNSIVSMIKPFSDRKNLKIAAALYRLTVHSEDAYATLAQICDQSGVLAERVKDCLEGEFAPFILETEAITTKRKYGPGMVTATK